MTPFWRGHYINLDRSPERRASIESQLAAAGLSDGYRRIAAVDGSLGKRPLGVLPGEWGCLQSHLMALSQPAEARFVHVLEDDAILSRDFTRSMGALIGSGKLSRFDLVFTDVAPTDWPYTTVRKLSQHWEKHQAGEVTLIGLRGFPYGGADSYFVNARSLAKVRGFVERYISGLTGTLAIDVIYALGIQSGALTACLTFPFLSAVDIELATKSEIVGDRTTPIDLLRYAFFIDMDAAALRRRIDAGLARIAASEHRDALGAIYKLILASPEPGSQ